MSEQEHDMQVNVEKYHEWIQLVAELTVSSLNSWQWASNSVFYLLGLWSRLVSSMPYLKGESPSLLETYVPKITEAYLTSRYAQTICSFLSNLLTFLTRHYDFCSCYASSCILIIRLEYTCSLACIRQGRGKPRVAS